MNSILQYLDPPIAYALGWTIVHSLWQASLIALLMSLIHKVGHQKNAAFKYNVSVFAMITVLATSLVTFTIYYSSTGAEGILFTGVELTTIALTDPLNQSQLGGIQSFFTNNLEHINLIWIVGVVLFITRFIGSYWYTKYLRKTAVYSQSNELNLILNRLKSSLFIDKAIQIAESSKIDVPLVLGHFKPLILFPIGMVNMLSTEEVEAIITHELAHIKRFDYLSNFLLTIVEILFYFHPAVWWISANVKAERENCCDDFALTHNIDKVVYAKALVRLEEIKMNRTPVLAMPFSSKKHQLLNRIKRIMNMPQTQNDMKEKSIATLLLLSIFLLFNTQVNSTSTSNTNLIEDTMMSDTLKISGEEEMVLTVKEGKFESLKVDNEISEGEVVEQVEAAVNSNSTDTESYTMTIKDRPILELFGNKVHIKGSGGIIYESDEDITNDLIQLDTLPDNSWSNNSTIISQRNGQVIEVEKKNGKVTKLKIDGKEIPESEYGNYTEEIESVNKIYQFDTDEDIFHFDGKDFGESFGLLFDGENWREFGGNFEHLMDSTFMKKLNDMEQMRFDFRGFENLDRLKGLERLHELEGLERLQELNGLGDLKELKNLEELFEELGIQMDTTFNGMNFKFHNFDGLNGFEFFDDFDFDDDITIFRDEDSGYKKGTVVDKIGQMLNKDGLLQEYKSNKIEITGKHLKINGEKMPKALFEKYKNIYQEATGAPLTKKSKMVFDVEGTPSKRKVRTF